MLRVDGVEFSFLAFDGESTPTAFHVAKQPELIDVYLELSREHAGGNIVELGIFGGGSTALLALLAAPRHLVAVDLSEERVAVLDEFLEGRGLDERVHPYYGVDQADTTGLRSILDAEVGDETLDLVIDDASHHLGPTLASFELLYPRLRPGGLYVIEDWNWVSHSAAIIGPTETEDHRREIEERALEPLVLELVLACAARSTAVDAVQVDESLALIRKGAGDLEQPFRLRRSSTDPAGFLRRSAD